MRYVILSAAMALAALTATASAQQPAPVKALAISTDRQALRPGDVVRYRLVFTNVTDVPVKSVEFKDPMPAGLRYVPASAGADRQDVAIDYSIDGGATYAARPMIVALVDGKPVRKAAPVELYTHIRWRVGGWVAPGARVTAEFHAVLPDPTQQPAGASPSR